MYLNTTVPAAQGWLEFIKALGGAESMNSPWVDDHYRKRLDGALRSKHLSSKQRETLVRLDEDWAIRGQTLATRMNKASRAGRLAQLLSKPFEEATRADLQAYLGDIATRCKPHTLAGTKIFLKSFYKDLLAPESDDHPAVVRWIKLQNPLKLRKLPRDLLTVDEILRMAGTTAHPRDRAIITVTYETAGRRGEIASLRVGDIVYDNLPGARVVLRGKTEERLVRIIHSLPDLQQWLNIHPEKAKPEAPLFVSWQSTNHYGPIGPQGIQEVIQQAARAAGITKRVYPHLLRHSRIAEWKRMDIGESKIKQLSGWDPDSAMLGVYGALTSDDADRTLLEKAGVVLAESAQPATLRLVTCKRCATSNAATIDYCTKCFAPLREKELLELEEHERTLEETLPELMELLRIPAVQKALKEHRKAARSRSTKEQPTNENAAT